jgi:hypothetical protein
MTSIPDQRTTRQRYDPLSGPRLAALHRNPARAIEPDRIICLDCGRSFRQLTNTHLARHGLSAEAYKARWGYPRYEMLACGALRSHYRQRAIATGLATRIRCRRLTPPPRGYQQRPVAIQRRLAATDYGARERQYTVHPREKPVDRQRLARLRAMGLSLRAIGLQLGVSPRTILRRLGHRCPSDYRPKYRQISTAAASTGSQPV